MRRFRHHLPAALLLTILLLGSRADSWGNWLAMVGVGVGMAWVVCKSKNPAGADDTGGGGK